MGKCDKANTTITELEHEKQQLVMVCQQQGVFGATNSQYEQSVSFGSQTTLVILWCSALSCGLQVNYVALRWTRGISLKGLDTQESTLAVPRLERGNLIYI